MHNGFGGGLVWARFGLWCENIAYGVPTPYDTVQLAVVHLSCGAVWLHSQTTPSMDVRNMPQQTVFLHLLGNIPAGLHMGPCVGSLRNISYLRRNHELLR
jgi:hypothetical protein